MQTQKITLGALLFSIFCFISVIAILLINYNEPIYAYSDNAREESQTSYTYTDENIELISGIIQCEVGFFNDYKFIEAKAFDFMNEANAILGKKLSKNINIYFYRVQADYLYCSNLIAGATYAQNIPLAISDAIMQFKD